MKYWLTGAKLGMIAWVVLLIITVFLDVTMFAGTLVLGWLLPVVGLIID